MKSRHTLAILGLAWTIQSQVRAQPVTPPADTWLTNAFSYPKVAAADSIRSNPLPILQAEIISGHLKIYLAEAASRTNLTASIFASQDSPGHWPARDWRIFPMLFRGANWEATLPVDDLYAPVIYFAQVKGELPKTDAGAPADQRSTNESVSPMRITIPGRLGMEIPSHPFYPFIEGFEEGLHRWEMVGRAPDDAEMQIVPLPHQGKFALEIRVPANQNSVTIATTRIRGRQLTDHHATGVQLWLRARTGGGRVRFTLFANARGSDQVSVQCNLPVPAIDTTWQKIELPLSAFPALPISEVDWFAIEFIGAAGTEFLLDDISLMGPWTLPGE